MNQHASEPSQAMVLQAAHWITRQQEGSCSPEEAEECRHWRDANPRHELAWQRMQALWDQLGQVPAAPARAALDDTFSRASRQRLRRLAGGSTALLLAGLTVALWSQSPGTDWLLASHYSPVGEQRRITLDDHSQLILNSRSAVDISYTAGERRIVLRRGEVLVEVAPDKQRPFVIETPLGTAEALGTRYLVKRDQDESGETTAVTVLESVVRACVPAPLAPTDCRELREGDQVSLATTGLGSTRKVDPMAASAWLQHQLVVDDRPLPEVLREVQRHRNGLLRFDAPALQGLRVSGVFPLDDTDRTLAILANANGLEVRRYSRWLTIVRRPDTP